MPVPINPSLQPTRGECSEHPLLPPSSDTALTPDILARAAEVVGWDAIPTAEQMCPKNLALLEQLVAATEKKDECKQLGY